MSNSFYLSVELGVVIGKRGRDVSTNDAPSFIKGYFLGLDMTARNLQEDAKKAVCSWSLPLYLHPSIQPPILS